MMGVIKGDTRSLDIGSHVGYCVYVAHRYQKHLLE